MKRFNIVIMNMIITIGGLGYWPMGGTLASLFAFGVMRTIPHSILYMLLLVLCVFCIGYYTITIFLLKYNTQQSHDPAFIVIDEVIGYMMGYTVLLFFHYTQYDIVFLLLFRVLDIIKPFGITKIEALPGAQGIIFDDCVAGLLASLIIVMVKYCSLFF